jgi:hypothetical protein
MTGFGYIFISLFVATAIQAAPITDPYVKNLTLVGVIHVQGANPKGQSVAVVREKSTGKTLMLHKGDSILHADLEVHELGPQRITLMRGGQTFVLRVEIVSEPLTVESSDVELSNEKSSSVVELVLPSEPTQDADIKPVTPREERRLIPDPDCEGEDCTPITD